MNHVPDSAPSRTQPKIDRVWLAAFFWVVVAAVGQWAFFAFMISFYGAPLLSGEFAAWNANTLLETPPYVDGHIGSTAAFGMHAIGAAIVSLIGILQLMPLIRHRLPAFHRWNGRFFLILVCALSFSGFFLVWVREPRPEEINDVSTSVNGLLILTFAFLAVRAAMSRNIAIHERWAVRLFLVSNAQWFFRIGLFGFFAGSQALGFGVTQEHPFFAFWNWGCFFAPLVVSELYFRARLIDAPALKNIAVAVLFLAALATAWGNFTFTMFLITQFGA